MVNHLIIIVLITKYKLVNNDNIDNFNYVNKRYGFGYFVMIVVNGYFKQCQIVM